ncbi:MAG TPA: M28 family peptidase [Thermodesulfovibrionales bacterium]|nr:M28 family peptidase [Thermodesulfovibrionales bacterium]
MDDIKDNIIGTVNVLAEQIGQRCYKDLEQLSRAADFIEQRLASHGCKTERQDFAYRGNTYCNIITEVKGTDLSRDDILVIGAHYDSAEGTPGADDNASGVAGLLELARLTVRNPVKRTVQFVAYCLEEPPAYMTKHMGSYVHAQSLHDRGVKVHGMISLEMLGYYCDQKGCQYYPSSFFKLAYPNTGHFIAFVGNFASRHFSNRVRTFFSTVSEMPVESLNGFSIIPGVDFSDHRNYWKFGYPAFMITDTAFYRNPNYHDSGDTADTLDYERTARLVKGLFATLSLI